jgi:CheY-like chemotaxis protein
MAVKQRKDVLIVDDDEPFRKLLCASLTDAGLTCDGVADGMDALEHLKTTIYAVVLLDLMMPRLDGVGVLNAIRALALGDEERPVVLVMTASADKEALFAHDDLVQFVIRKPLSVIELRHVVQSCVEARKRPG